MVGKRIREYLLNNGIKQGFVAEKVGITNAKMSEICNKGRSIECEVYYRICKVLNVPFETFMEGE